MKQIQHNWEGNYFHKVCTKCNAHKYKNIELSYHTYSKGDNFMREPPKCIPVKENAPASDKPGPSL